MPTRQVTIIGIMSWEDAPTTPPSPGVPTHPIMLPGMPGWGDPHPAHPIVIPPQQPQPPNQGAHPEHPIYNPPGIWGPPGPWPTPPIAGIPGLPGYNPPLWPGYPGQPPYPAHPIVLPDPPVQLPPGGVPMPPAAGVPIEGKLVWIPGRGYVFIPNTGKPETPPEPEPTPE